MDVPFREEVRDRVNHGLRHEIGADLLVVRSHVLGSIDLGEAPQGVSGKWLDLDGMRHRRIVPHISSAKARLCG